MASSSSSSSISSAAQLFFNLSLTLFLFCSFSSALRYPSSHQTQLGLSTEMIPAKGQAERLIRSLNLFPKHDANIVLNDQSAKDAPAISERQFNLNVTGAAPGPSIQQFGHYAGYYSLPSTKGAKMFYFFFESRVNKTDAPVVIWLTGGPGCASELALFYENGPFQIKEDMSLVWNDFGWDQASNILYVDQPTGTGFSYTTDDSDIRHNEVGVSNDMYNFLQGFAIGNGLTDPAFQYKAYPEYAAMVGDWMQDYEVGIPALLESGIKVLIYAGEYDLICNWVGNSNWVNGMKWSGQKKFQSAQTVPFVAGNTKSGELKSYGPLAFLKVYNAGHMVPMDQPKAALQMLEGWMQGKLSLMTTASTKQKISLV
ncbi:Serine carboxypeptidase-like 49 [Linum perenne]